LASHYYQGVVSDGSQPSIIRWELKVFNTPSFSDFFYITVEKVLIGIKTNTITAGKSRSFNRTVEEVKRTLVFFVCVKVLNLDLPEFLFWGFV
jgi:hypothetical protein